jgi:hypothetical protein
MSMVGVMAKRGASHVHQFHLIASKSESEAVGSILSYIVLFKQLIGIKSPFAYPLLLPPLRLDCVSAAFTADESDR